MQVAVAVIASWAVFRNPISSMNAFGCAVTLVGCSFYGFVRQKLAQQVASPRGNNSGDVLELMPLVNVKQDKA